LELPTSSMIFTTAMRILLVGPRWSPWRRCPRAGRPAARRASAPARAARRRRTRPRTARSRRRRPRPRPLWRSSVPPTKPLPPASHGPGIAPWIILGAGGLTLTAAAVTGILALEKDSALDRRCNEPGGLCPPSERDAIESEQNELETLMTTTDVLLVTGSVLAVTGAGWLWLARDRTPAQVSASATTHGLYLGVRGRL